MKISELYDVKGYGVIVTGGASGLGLAYTEALAENGARVTLLDVNPQRVAEETQRLRGLGLDVRGDVVDVTDHAALDRAIDEAAGVYPKVRSRTTPTSAGTASSTSTSTVCSPRCAPSRAT
jgi:NAD(P)-dependent dehydrogenase (short-subunit alcohol dehydrogenase family)